MVLLFIAPDWAQERALQRRKVGKEQKCEDEVSCRRWVLSEVQKGYRRCRKKCIVWYMGQTTHWA